MSIMYYSHDIGASDHWKFRFLREHYGEEKGWAMEGRFWALNGLIGAAENCRLDLRRPQIRMDTAEKLSLSLQDFDEFIAFCADEKQGDLLHNDDGVLWTDRCQEELESVLEARDRDRGRKKGVKPEQGEFSNRNPPGKPSIPHGIHPENGVFHLDSNGKGGFSRELEGTRGEEGGNTENGKLPPPSASASTEPQEKASPLAEALKKVDHHLSATASELEQAASMEVVYGQEQVLATYRLWHRERPAAPFAWFLKYFDEWRAKLPLPAPEKPPAKKTMEQEREELRALIASDPEGVKAARLAALQLKSRMHTLTTEERAELIELGPPNIEQAEGAENDLF